MCRSLPVLAISALVLVLVGCTVGGDGAASAIAQWLSATEDEPPVATNRPTPAVAPKVTLPGQAVLVRGSESVRGIAAFGRNAIPALFGEYAFAATGAETQILSVWFTREALVLDEAWSVLSCPGLPAGFVLAQSGSSVAGSLVVVASTNDYRLVISLPAGSGSPCRFTAVLIERFTFFMRNAVMEEDISFPAFLQL